MRVIDYIPFPIAPTAVRYIKLGESESWLRECVDQGVIKLGHGLIPHELATAGAWGDVEQVWKLDDRSPGKAKDFTREVRDFYTLGSDCLWITIGSGKLWWAFAEPDVIALSEDGQRRRARKVIGAWSDRDADGRTLALSCLSTRLTKVAGYRQTLCKVGAEDYLVRRINAELEPAVAQAFAAHSASLASVSALIQLLDWRDFELLVDLIFAASGWRRTSAVGGSDQADTDLILEQAATGERAFVQGKSSATGAGLADYIDRFERDGSFDRMFFVCHSPRGEITQPSDRRVHVWLAERLADQILKAGLFDWLVEKAR